MIACARTTTFAITTPRIVTPPPPFATGQRRSLQIGRIRVARA